MRDWIRLYIGLSEWIAPSFPQTHAKRYLLLLIHSRKLVRKLKKSANFLETYLELLTVFLADPGMA